MIVISTRDLLVSYAQRVVLTAPDISIEEGDQVALTGRSGSGKTTLLLVLAGLLEPTEGSVSREIPTMETLYVPQAPSLIPELSALHNAALGLRVRGVSPETAIGVARQQLQLLGLTDVDEVLPSELSGGMQQRVALGRALATGPRLLLLDEPTGALDQTTGERVLSVIHEWATRTGATLVLATHDPAVARQFPSQVALDGVVA